MFERANAIGAGTGGSAVAVADPVEAVTGADVVVTDTWVSMGKEEESAAREAVFGPWSLTTELVGHARPDAIVLHCLPAYRGKEIAAEVLDGPQSVVWDEAENRRHAQKAVLAFLMERSAGSRERVRAPAGDQAGPAPAHRRARSPTTRSARRPSLADLLAAGGVRVTQATLSRDLVELDAIKVRSASGALVYAVPAEGGDRRPAAPVETAAASARLARLCGELLGQRGRQRQPGRPAHAARSGPVPGLGLRQGGVPEILGTIAGDDTVLVIGRDPVGGDDLARRFLVARRPPRQATPQRQAEGSPLVSKVLTSLPVGQRVGIAFSGGWTPRSRWPGCATRARSLHLHRRHRPVRRARHLRRPRPGACSTAPRSPAPSTAARRWSRRAWPRWPAAPSTSAPAAAPTSTPPRSAARSPAACWCAP